MLNRTAAIRITPGSQRRERRPRPGPRAPGEAAHSLTQKYTHGSPRTPGSRATRSFPAAARQCLLLVLLGNLGRALRNHTTVRTEAPGEIRPASLARHRRLRSLVYTCSNTCRVNSLIRTLPLPPALLPRLGPAAVPALVARFYVRGSAPGVRRARGWFLAGVVRSEAMKVHCVAQGD